MMMKKLLAKDCALKGDGSTASCYGLSIVALSPTSANAMFRGGESLAGPLRVLARFEDTLLVPPRIRHRCPHDCENADAEERIQLQRVMRRRRISAADSEGPLGSGNARDRAQAA